MNEAIPSAYSAASAEPRVSSLELFLDLVFVFTMTQLSALVAILVVGAIVDGVVVNRRSVS